MTRLMLRPIGVALWLGLLVAAGLHFGGADFFRDFEFDTLDARFRSSQESKRKFSNKIALIELNDESVHVQQRVPWDDDKLATLLVNLRKAKPGAIALELPLLHSRPETLKRQLKKLLDEYAKLHPPPTAPAPAAKGKKGKSRRLSRRQQEELARQQVLQKSIEAVRKLIDEAVKDPGHQRLLKEIKATKNLILSYTYHQDEKDILGVDGVYYKQKQQEERERARAAKKKKDPKAKPAKDEKPVVELFQISRSQLVNGAQPQTPALSVHFLRDNPEAMPLARFHGFLNLTEDPGKVFRTARLIVRQEQKVYPSLALAAYSAFTGKNPTLLIGPTGYVAIDFQDHSIPLTSDGRYWVNYYGAPNKAFRGQRVLAGDIIAEKNFTASDIAGKLVFVGYSSTPIASHYRTPFKQLFSGLQLQATVASNLLQGDSLQRSASTHWIELGVFLAFALLLGLLSMAFRYVLGFFVTIVLIALLQFANHFFLFPTGAWYQFLGAQFGLFVVWLGISVVRRYSEDIQREQTRNRFQPRMGKEDFQRVLKRPQDIPLAGSWRPLTVLSGDTLPLGQKLSEDNNPQQITKLLSHLINPIGDVIGRNHGTISQLDGHNFQGFFNAPFDLASHVENTCLAALQICSDCEPFLHQWQLEGLPLPVLSIGIDTGHAVAGNLGGTDRFHYSVVGAPVEQSVQLKHLNRTYRSRILISAELHQQIKDGGRFVVRELDWIRTQDDQPAIPIFELLGTAPAGSPIKEAAEWYQHGLNYYRARNFQEAIRYFQEILRVRPDDGPAKVMLDRSQHYSHYPPSFQWDGTWKVKN